MQISKTHSQIFTAIVFKNKLIKADINFFKLKKEIKERKNRVEIESLISVSRQFPYSQAKTRGTVLEKNFKLAGYINELESIKTEYD